MRRHRRYDQVEKRYQDVMQNLELAVVQVMREEPELIDAHVEQAFAALIRHYRAEARGYEPRPPRLTSLAEVVFDNVQGMAEMRLGRATLVDETTDAPVALPFSTISVDVLIDCLKRLRKSVQFWSGQGGRRGYLRYIDQFFPE